MTVASSSRPASAASVGMSSASARFAACCRTSRAVSCSPRWVSVSPRRRSAAAACGSGAGAVVLGYRAAQPGCGLVVAPEEAGEAPDVVLVGAEASDRAGDDREQRRVRLEQGVERRAGLAVGHEHGGVGQDARAVPVGVHRQGAAAVSAELGDQPASLLRRPGLGVEQRQVDEPLGGGGRGRGALDDPRAVDLVDAPLGVEAVMALDPDEEGGVRVVGLASECERPLGQLARRRPSGRPAARAWRATAARTSESAGARRRRRGPRRRRSPQPPRGRGRARAGRPRASCAPAAPPRDRRPPRRRRSSRRRRPVARRRGAGTTARRGGRSAQPRGRRHRPRAAPARRRGR